MDRRHLIRAVPALALATALPAPAIANRIEGRWTDLVAIYVAAKARFDAVGAQWDELWSVVALPDARVVVSINLHTKEPAYAHCEKDIRAELSRWRGPWNSPAANAAVDARIEKKVAEYWAIRVERDRLSRESGLTAVETDLEAASDAEYDAFMALVTYCPERHEVSAKAEWLAAYAAETEGNAERVESDFHKILLSFAQVV